MTPSRNLVVIAIFMLADFVTGTHATKCTGAGGPDKIRLPAGYSKANLPSKPENVNLTFKITDITDIDAISNVSFIIDFFTSIQGIGCVITLRVQWGSLNQGKIGQRTAFNVKIHLHSQQLHMNGYLTLQWNDTRVKVTGERESDGTVILDKSCLGAVWTPDIWIERLVEFTQQKVTGSKFISGGSKVAE